MIKNVQLWIYCFLWPAGYTRPILILQALYYYNIIISDFVLSTQKEVREGNQWRSKAPECRRYGLVEYLHRAYGTTSRTTTTRRTISRASIRAYLILLYF
jgi:hypothetical protein